MNIKTLKLDDLNPAIYNPRSINEDEFNGLVKSLETFGQQENLIVNKDMTVISGHMRLEAMKFLGWDEAVCNLVDLNKVQEKKLNVLMNSQFISGNWDQDKLTEVLEELKLEDDFIELRLDKLQELDLSDQDNQLPEQKLIKCPECGHEFTKKEDANQTQN
jgi:ParB family chromosome partitioning protein